VSTDFTADNFVLKRILSPLPTGIITVRRAASCSGRVFCSFLGGRELVVVANSHERVGVDNAEAAN
jgi:hypothetical protein